MGAITAMSALIKSQMADKALSDVATERYFAMDISGAIYNQLKRFIPMDRSAILWLNTHEFLPAKPVPGAECRPLNGEDIKRLSLIKDFGIDARLAEDFDALGFVGIGIFVNKKLAGLSLFTTDDVPGYYTKHRERFNGIQLHLPPGTRCLFKAVVLPEFRGQRLHSAVVRYAIDHFGKDTVHTIVTTTDIANRAFLASSLDQGFERVGKATEISLLGKSLYRFPKPIDSLTGELSKSKDLEENEESCIMLRKANYVKPDNLEDAA